MVETAVSGSEGLRLATIIKPDLITLDTFLPDIDGWEVLNSIKTDQRLKEIPVIMVTVADEKSRALKQGAADYLRKPIHEEHLMTLLRKY